MKGEFDGHELSLFCLKCDTGFCVLFGKVKASAEAVCPRCKTVNRIDVFAFHRQMKRTQRLMRGDTS
jgi:phage FluMu protein Com